MQFSSNEVYAIKQRVKPPHIEGPPVIDEGMLSRCLQGNDWYHKSGAEYVGIRGKVKWSEQATNLLIMRGRGVTLEQCADHFGVTRERVRQVEAKCLRRLRNLAGLRYFTPEGK